MEDLKFHFPRHLNSMVCNKKSLIYSSELTREVLISWNGSAEVERLVLYCTELNILSVVRMYASRTFLPEKRGLKAWA